MRVTFCVYKLLVYAGIVLVLTNCSSRVDPVERAFLESNALYQLGLSSLKAHDNTRALRLFEKAEKLSPTIPKYRIHQAIVLNRLGEFEVAEKILRETCQEFPSVTECKNTLSTVLISRKLYSEAIEISKEVLAHPDYSSPEFAWANMATAQLYLGYFEESLHSVEKALRLNENMCNVLNLKAKILMHHLDYRTAIEEIQKATLKCPRNWVTHAWEAYLYFKIGSKEASVQKLLKIRRNFTTSEAKIYSYMALKRLEQGRAFEEPRL